MARPAYRTLLSTIIFSFLSLARSWNPASFQLLKTHPGNVKNVDRAQHHSQKEFHGFRTMLHSKSNDMDENNAPVVIIGAGMSGLTAARTIQNFLPHHKILVLESGSNVGGRVQSEYEGGFTFDRGFAVFIEKYPKSQEMFDYAGLGLCPFLPGAMIFYEGRMHTILDPRRFPTSFPAAVMSPIGTLLDKFRLFPLLLRTLTSSIPKIFEMEEDNTLHCLKSQYKFSDRFIQSFWAPFLSGIYFTNLGQQSSRLFHFAFKMFVQGDVSLPTKGMQAVSDQLADSLNKNSVQIELDAPVSSIEVYNSTFFIRMANSTVVPTDNVIVATDGATAHKLLSDFPGLETLKTSTPLPQRRVMCIYYTFDTPAPIQEKLLILNGEGKGPINNICFPSVVNDAYAPPGYEMCSITVLEPFIDRYQNDKETLDQDLREQLSLWFPTFQNDIMERWTLAKVYVIENAQPCHYGPDSSFPANVNGGRDCSSYRGVELPEGLLVCGDHMASSTFNGALESGMNAGKVTADRLDS